MSGQDDAWDAHSSVQTIDGLQALRRFTPARIALGRAGASMPTAALLEFGLAHARARDAVHEALDVQALDAGLRELGFPALCTRSLAVDRRTYLMRPDLGRRLDEASALELDTWRAACLQPPEIVIALEDGLSARAVQRHAVPLLAALRAHAPGRWTGLPVVIGLQGRVALGDEIGERVGASLIVVMIGERPGLTSPDSLGLYVTHSPRRGRTDAERNCISNIRPEGLGYREAAHRLDGLVSAALAQGMSGVALKDEPPPVLP